jgi:predicted O-linked N-acetylglucosamine transferase (SPINDLY family)
MKQRVKTNPAIAPGPMQTPGLPVNSANLMALGQARALMEQQRFADAEQLLHEVLRADPRNHAAMHLLALLACVARRFDVAAPLASEAARLSPADASYRVTLGRARKGLGELPEAERALRHALQIDARLADAQVLLGMVLKAQGRHDEAIAAYRAALVLRPDFAEAQVNLANVLREQGEQANAAILYRKAAAAAPHLAEAQSAFAASLLGQGRDREALDQYRRALELNPDQPDQQFLRGLLSQQQGGSSAEAIDAYSKVVSQFPGHANAWVNLGLALIEGGRANEAIGCYRRALEVDPDHLETHINYGLALSAYNANTEAIAMLRRATELRPDHAQALNNLGAILIIESRLVEAEEVLRRAQAIQPGSAQILTNLGAALRGPGRQRESVEVLRSVLAADPDHRTAHFNLLLSLLYADGVSAAEFVAAARDYGSRHISAPAAPQPPDASVAAANLGKPADPNRRLRVGYVSPDLRRHSVAYFVEPVLAHHDRSRFEIYCYQLLAHEDDVSQRLRGLCDHWFNAYGLPYEALAKRIRDDGIDILVDLAGHTGFNGLLAFAARPSPVQMTWLGFPATVGLPAIEYRITDWQVDPQGYEVFSTETPLRLPHSYFCYRPEAAPAIGASPVASNGYLTFASFNSLSKLSESTVRLWTRVLLAVPGSRLVLKNRMFGEAGTRQRVGDAFAAVGLPADRLELLAWTADTASHLEIYNRVDIALDTFPYNGATTTCEALWMGVPVVSRCGETQAARMGRSILGAAGLAEFVADSDDAFVQIATSLAAERRRLADLRTGLREQLAASPLMDETGFTRALEQTYLGAWSATLSA